MTNAVVEEQEDDIDFVVTEHGKDRRCEVWITRKGNHVGTEWISSNAMDRAIAVCRERGFPADMDGKKKEFLEVLLMEGSYIDHHYESNGFVHFHEETAKRPQIEVLEKCSMDEYFEKDE